MVACTQSIFPSKILFKKPQIKDKKTAFNFSKAAISLQNWGGGNYLIMNFLVIFWLSLIIIIL